MKFTDLSKWDRRFLDLADHIALWSKDSSTQVGAVIVGPAREIRSTGYNGFPKGVADGPELPERHARPAKYSFTHHAERNALDFAARNGVPMLGCTMYVTLIPCADCARGIISCGIQNVFAIGSDRQDWAASWAVTRQMFLEAGVHMCEVSSDRT